MKQALMLSVTVAAMICAASAAEAQNVPTLKGTYGDTFSQTCLTSDPNGFNSSFQANPGDTNTLTSGHWKGTWTFNGDGNGTGEFTNLFVGAPIPPSPTTLPPPDAESRDVKFSFTYTVNADGSWTAKVKPGTWSFTILTGPSAGQTGYATNLPPWTGWISRGGNTLTATTLTPTMKIDTLNGVTHYAICTNSGVLIKLADDAL